VADVLPREKRLPPRWLPLLYFGFAHLALDRMAWLAAAGWLLLAAVVLDGIGAVRVVRRARKGNAPSPETLERDGKGGQTVKPTGRRF
jgi:hypothetical protein